MKRLLLLAVLNFFVGAAILGVVIFLFAGTVHYWQAWVFIVVFSACANGIGIYLSIKDPALLERRKKVRPSSGGSPAQKAMSVLIVVGVLLLLIVPALGRRFGWFAMATYISLLGDCWSSPPSSGTTSSFGPTLTGAQTVEVFEGQHVISTGPYAIVRHPCTLWSWSCVSALSLLWVPCGGCIVVRMQVPVLGGGFSTRSGCWSAICPDTTSTCTGCPAGWCPTFGRRIQSG